MRSSLIIRLSTALLLLGLLSSNMQAQTAPQLFATAQAEFAKQNYDTAIQQLKKYLRVFPQDYHAWSLLGASYLYAGLPKKGLQTLQKVARLTQYPSFNYFHQALCYSVLDYQSTALKYFEYVAYFNDESGAKATFELAVIAYNNREIARAKYFLNSYMQRFPTGAYRARVMELIRSIDNQSLLSDVKGVDRPDLEKAAYKYSNLSLTDFPHYWWAYTGYQSLRVDGFAPNNPPPGSIVRNTNDNYAFLSAAGIGFGPLRENLFTAWGGYNYRQNWLTDANLVEDYFSNPGDFSKFFLQPYFMERKHQLYGDIRRQIGSNFYLGMYGRFEFTRLGSSQFPSPDGSDLQVVINQSDTTLAIPWAGVSFTENLRSLLYLYMRKEINNASREHSNQSYDLTGGTGKRTVSLGLSNGFDFPNIGLSTTLELFQYDFIYNDFWLDYTRRGALAGAEFEVFPNLFVTALAGFYDDTYIVERIKLGPCDSITATNTNTENPTDPSASQTVANTCKRKDSGTLFQGGIYYNLSQNTRLRGTFQLVQNTSKMKEFSEGRQTIQVDITWAFPSVKRVSRFTDRFADSAFTKEVQQ